MAVIRAALAGNPNVGKSTVFNALTGLRQHTGNWPGKTVETKEGQFFHNGHTIRLTDVPGTYSLTAHSPEEEVTRLCLEQGDFDCVIVVCDGSTLSRNLILALQILATGARCVVCLNLMDEARRRGITVDTEKLAELLGCPVVPCTARRKKGLSALCDMVTEPSPSTVSPHPVPPVEDIPALAQRIDAQVTRVDPARLHRREHVLDGIFAGRYTALPVMALLVLLVCWLTLRGAGILSNGLGMLFAWLLPLCRTGLDFLAVPSVVTSFLVDGVLTTLTQVIAVMLPPMAVFFPLFTLLEDLGYLPRVAFCLDRCYRGCGACGKQGLTMLMSLGCHAAGVTGCRIIDSPRERHLALLTCSFVPCNGRLPMVLFCTAGMMLCWGSALVSDGGQALFLCLVLAFSVAVTLLVCGLLSHTLLRGTPSAFTLELPKYRIPQVGQVLLRSVLDRTVLVLGRAISAAAPAGALLWLLSRIVVGDASLLVWLIRFLEPIGHFFGMDGVILAAFLLSFPAAELFLPLVLSGYGLTGLAGDAVSLVPLLGWNGVTLLCVLCFTLFHFPCATTLLTIRRETGSLRWTMAAALLPTLVGLLFCACIRWGSVLIGILF